ARRTDAGFSRAARGGRGGAPLRARHLRFRLSARVGAALPRRRAAGAPGGGVRAVQHRPDDRAGGGGGGGRGARAGGRGGGGGWGGGRRGGRAGAGDGGRRPRVAGFDRAALAGPKKMNPYKTG